MLRKQQYFKCCYCERNNLEAKGYDVEHYRPAMSADRGKGVVDNGYWWLAWNWDNLMFACNVCNRWEKNDLFPLDVGSVALKPKQHPSKGREKPLLLDPAVDNPFDHIQFQFRKMTRTLSRWIPEARGNSYKGLITIEVLDLKRNELLDLYKHHVETQVQPFVNHLRAQMLHKDLVRVREVWDCRIRILVSCRSPFTALSYDAIDHLVPAAERKAWKLRLTRPR